MYKFPHEFVAVKSPGSKISPRVINASTAVSLDSQGDKQTRKTSLQNHIAFAWFAKPKGICKAMCGQIFEVPLKERIFEVTLYFFQSIRNSIQIFYVRGQKLLGLSKNLAVLSSRLLKYSTRPQYPPFSLYPEITAAKVLISLPLRP